MATICGDNRFNVISKAREALLESTNIKESPEEMAVLDSFLFRCWQMGWLDKYNSSFNVVEPEEVLKAINTIKEFCRQTSSKDCDEGKCEIHTWCDEYSNILPEEWKAGE